MKLMLNEFLHPTHEQMSNWIEQSIRRMQMVCEMLLYRHSTEAIQRRWDVHFIGDALMYNYAMFAAAARSSRAYCEGMRYAAEEVMAAEALIEPVTRAIKNYAVDVKFDRTGPSEHMQKLSHLFVIAAERHTSRRNIVPMFSLMK